jgi:putative flippase GtrA
MSEFRRNRQVDHIMTQRIEQFIDFFYTPFSRFMNRMTFRYAACGGANTLFDIFLFFISYNFVFDKQIVRLPFISISPYIAAFMLSFCITFPIGFLLNRYVVFQGSVIAGRIQFFRYGVTVVVSLLLNYLFLKLFVEWLGLFPTVAKILTTFIVVGFSYLSQSYFTFKVKSYRSQ